MTSPNKKPGPKSPRKRTHKSPKKTSEKKPPQQPPGKHAEQQKQPQEIRVRDARFLAAATELDQLPAPLHPEIAFVGKSNVGKSSLINALTERRKLVRTSRTPGCTRGANAFLVELAQPETAVQFIDLPGYGYAQRSKTERNQWAHLVESILLERGTLRAVVALFDIRRDLSKDDRTLLEFLAESPATVIPVATKADKIAPSQLAKTLKTLKESMGASSTLAMTNLVPFSCADHAAPSARVRAERSRNTLWHQILTASGALLLFSASLTGCHRADAGQANTGSTAQSKTTNGSETTSGNSDSSPVDPNETTSLSVQDWNPSEQQLRQLGTHTPWAEVIRNLATLDQKFETLADTAPGCLFQQSPSEGTQFVGETAVAMHPVPKPDGAIMVRAARASQVVLLTRWGAFGSPAAQSTTAHGASAQDTLTLIGITAFPGSIDPTTDLVLWVVGQSDPDHPIFTRRTISQTQVTESETLSRLETSSSIPGLQVVLATGETGFQHVQQLLKHLSSTEGTHTVIAAAAPQGIQLPRATPDTRISACPAGLPNPPNEMGTTDGNLSANQARELHQSLGAHIQTCFEQPITWIHPRGNLQVAVRIAPHPQNPTQGQLQTHCFIQDELLTPRFTVCVQEHLTQMQWPNPNGPLDLILPYQITPNPTQHKQRPLCNPGS